MIYIYGLKCPVLGVIRYVGKSTNPERRLIGHITHALCGQYNHHTARWIRKLHRDGLRPELVILRAVESHERWQDVERDIIASAAANGWKLTNSTKGGEGLDYLKPEDKARYRKNLSAALKKIWNTPEAKEKARQQALRSWSDPVSSKKRVAAIKTALAAPGVQAALRETMAEINKRPEVKDKRRATMAKRRTEFNRLISEPETRLKMSASAKARWSDADERAKLIAIRSTPESKARLSASAIRRATPEYRAMMAEKTRLSWEKRRQNPAE